MQIVSFPSSSYAVYVTVSSIMSPIIVILALKIRPTKWRGEQHFSRT
jgi:hypothetical protein